MKRQGPASGGGTRERYSRTVIQPGASIEGRYQLDRELGRGGAAAVFEGMDLELRRPVALKFLTGEGLIADPARFEEEARILAELSHPHILAVYGSGVHDGTPYLVLELVDGGSLHARIFAGALEPEEQQRHALAVASALAAAHSRGILHRDVKPENVLLTREGTAKLSDFGLAKSSGSSVRTRTGWILGTPEFLAPEILKGEAAGPASDVYAWGCLAYFLANRSPPVRGDLREIMRAHAGSIYRPGRERGELARALRLALDPDPRRRPSADTLTRVLTGELQAPTQQIRALAAAGLAPRGAGAPAAPGRLLRLGAGLGLLAAIAATGWRLLAGASPDAAVQPGPLPESRGALETWRSRTRGLDASARIAALHRLAVPSPEAADYLEVMSRHRRRPDPAVAVDVLQEQARGLPWIEEFQRDRARLQALLAAPGRAAGDRAELLEALRPLAYLDAYLEALGEPAPYGVRALTQAAFPHRFVPGVTPRPDLASLTDPEVDPGPGRHLLRQWTAEPDRTYPWLVAHGGEPHAKELQWLLLAKMATQNQWRMEEHQFLRGRFTLGARPEDRYREARVRVEIANFFLPQLLRIELNGVEVDVLRSPEGAPESKWRARALGQEDFEMRFPVDALREGLNAIRVTVRPLPGLLRYQGIEADRLWIELVPIDGVAW